LEYVFTFIENKVKTNYYGENGLMIQQHPFSELKNVKVSGDFAISYLNKLT